MGRSDFAQPSRFVALAAFVASFAAFVPVLRNGFLHWDDGTLLVHNEAYRGLSGEHLAWMFTTTHKGPYQPLAWLSYGFDYTLYGMQPWGYHLTSLLIHAAAAAFLAAALVRLLPLAVPALTSRPRLVAGAALVAAVFWGVHPLRVESVAWAAERRDVLSGLFLFASLWSWTRHLSSHADARRWARSLPYWGALALFVLSVATKPTAVAFGLALLLLDLPLRRAATLGARVLEKVPFLVAGALFSVVAYWGQSGAGFVHSGTDTTLLDRVAIAGYSATFYVVKTLVPTGLRVHYIRDFPFDPFAWHVATGVAVAVLVSAGTLLAARRRPALAAAWWSYLFLLAPVSGLTTLGSQLVGDRFAYVTTVPLLVLVTVWAARHLASAPSPRLRVVRVAAAAVVALLGTGSLLLARTWYDTETLFARVVSLAPHDWRAQTVYATGAYENGHLDVAARHARISVELHPTGQPFPWALLGWVAYREGRAEEASQSARRALAEEPQQPIAHRTLASLADDAGDLETAARHLGVAVAAAPRNARYLTHFAFVELRRGDAAHARELVDRALAESAEDAGTWRVLGLLHEGAGDLVAAEDAYRRSVALHSESAAALQSLALLVGGRGDRAEAAQLLQRAVDAAPLAVEPRMLLGGLLEAEGTREDAERLYREAVDLAPDEPRARGNLARLLALRGATVEAIEHCERAVALLPDDPGPRLQLALLQRDAGNTDDARRMAEAARDLARSRGDEALVRRIEKLLTRL